MNVNMLGLVAHHVLKIVNVPFAIFLPTVGRTMLLQHLLFQIAVNPAVAAMTLG